MPEVFAELETQAANDPTQNNTVDYGSIFSGLDRILGGLFGDSYTQRRDEITGGAIDAELERRKAMYFNILLIVFIVVIMYLIFRNK